MEIRPASGSSSGRSGKSARLIWAK